MKRAVLAELLEGRIFLLASCLAVVSVESFAAPVPVDRAELGPGVRIRVRLNEGASVVQVRGFDLQIHDSPGSGSVFGRTSAVMDRTTSWEFRCHENRVRAISSNGRSLDLESPVSIRTPVGFLHYRARPYREELRIHSMGSLCEVINSVDLEKYLDGLVNSEFNSRWAEEAIAAQVVAARTYALHQMRQSRSQHFDVDATVKDQVYDGSMKEDFRSSRSVARTRGLVLTTGPSSDPAPIKAFYHSTCGGKTELPEAVWGQKTAGFKRHVVCLYCASSPAFHWDTELTRREIERSFREGALADGKSRSWPSDWTRVIRQGRLADLQISAQDPSGRVREVKGIWSLGGRLVDLAVSGVRLRQWLGYAKFKSASFRIRREGGEFRFLGRGNGHGVGMCQYGAKGMGENGYKVAEILRHYYPDAVLRRLW